MTTKIKTTVREQIIDVFRAEGYDIFTACESTDTVIREFKRDKKVKERTIFVNSSSFKLMKK